MKSQAEILRLQIRYCEAYLSSHAVDNGSLDYWEIRSYVKAQLALATSVLLVEMQLQEVARTTGIVNHLKRFAALPITAAA